MCYRLYFISQKYLFDSNIIYILSHLALFSNKPPNLIVKKKIYSVKRKTIAISLFLKMSEAFFLLNINILTYRIINLKKVFDIWRYL